MEAAMSVEAREAVMIERFERARKKVEEKNARERSSMFTVNDMLGGIRMKFKVAERENLPDTDFLMTSNLHYTLAKAFEEGDFDNARDILQQLKDVLSGVRSLPPHFKEETINTAAHQRLAAKTYEIAVIISVLDVDHDAFESDFNLLRPYYTDKRVWIGSSGREYALVRLNLLRLLLQNRIADFHAELESLADATEINPRSYFKETSGPEYDRVFVEQEVLNFVLSPTDRQKLSELRVKRIKLLHGYKYISVGQELMLSLSEQKLSKYMQEHPEWEMKNGCVAFSGRPEKKTRRIKVMKQLINETLSYVMDIRHA